MPLVDMKLPKKTEKDIKVKAVSVSPTQPKYPYGLELNFEKEQIAKLPALKNAKIGDKLNVSAEAVVTTVRKSERTNTDGEDNSSHNVELQIQKIQVTGDDDKEFSEGFRAATEKKK